MIQNPPSIFWGSHFWANILEIIPMIYMRWMGRRYALAAPNPISSGIMANSSAILCMAQANCLNSTCTLVLDIFNPLPLGSQSISEIRCITHSHLLSLWNPTQSSAIQPISRPCLVPREILWRMRTPFQSGTVLRHPILACPQAHPTKRTPIPNQIAHNLTSS